MSPAPIVLFLAVYFWAPPLITHILKQMPVCRLWPISVIGTVAGSVPLVLWAFQRRFAQPVSIEYCKTWRQVREVVFGICLFSLLARAAVYYYGNHAIFLPMPILHESLEQLLADFIVEVTGAVLFTVSGLCMKTSAPSRVIGGIFNTFTAQWVASHRRCRASMTSTVPLVAAALSGANAYKFAPLVATAFCTSKFVQSMARWRQQEDLRAKSL